MKLKLSIKERMLMLTTPFMVQNSNTNEQLLIKEFLTIIIVTPKESNKAGMHTDPDGMTRWDEAKEGSYDIDLTQEMFDLLKKSVEQLEQKEGINQDNLDFVLKINNLQFKK